MSCIAEMSDGIEISNSYLLCQEIGYTRERELHSTKRYMRSPL